MRTTTGKYHSNAGKIFLSAGFILLLLFLTSVNYFLYSPSGQSASAKILVCTDTSDDGSATDLPNSPAGPDEKSPNTPVSITVEYVHEHEDPINPLWMNTIFTHKVHESEKLRVVHFELLSPPPEA